LSGVASRAGRGAAERLQRWIDPEDEMMMGEPPMMDEVVDTVPAPLPE
jgi:hypothetical protein